MIGPGSISADGDVRGRLNVTTLLRGMALGVGCALALASVDAWLFVHRLVSMNLPPITMPAAIGFSEVRRLSPSRSLPGVASRPTPGSAKVWGPRVGSSTRTSRGAAAMPDVS